MDIYNFNYNAKNYENLFEYNSTLLIGKFNVFHKGHEELLDKAREISADNKIGITLFEISPEISKSKKILTLKSRLENLAEIGFDFVVIINFNFEIKSLHAKDFIDSIVKKYNIKNFVVGKDFRFGHNRMWGSNDLKEYFENTFICETKKINNIKISSASIAEMITTGEIKLINELLMTPYNPVIRYIDEKLVWDDDLLKPHNGIYFIKVEIENYWYHGLLHLSMVGEDKIVMLNYDANFSDDFYNIQIFEEARIIINSRFDLIKEEDKKNCFEFFYTLQQKNI